MKKSKRECTETGRNSSGVCWSEKGWKPSMILVERLRPVPARKRNWRDQNFARRSETCLDYKKKMSKWIEVWRNLSLRSSSPNQIVTRMRNTRINLIICNAWKTNSSRNKSKNQLVRQISTNHYSRYAHYYITHCEWWIWKFIFIWLYLVFSYK